jgi:transposase
LVPSLEGIRDGGSGHLPRTGRPDRRRKASRKAKWLRRRAGPACDAEVYKQRDVVEPCFNRLGQFRDLGTHHTELTILAITSGSDDLHDTPRLGLCLNVLTNQWLPH